MYPSIKNIEIMIIHKNPLTRDNLTNSISSITILNAACSINRSYENWRTKEGKKYIEFSPDYFIERCHQFRTQRRELLNIFNALTGLT